MRRSLAALAAAVAVLGSPAAPAVGQGSPGNVAADDDQRAIVIPAETVAGTATPTSSETPVPLETSIPAAGQTPTATPIPTQKTYISPGYGNAAIQADKLKRREIAHACNAANTPPTSRMLGTRGVVGADPAQPWVPILIGIAIGAAIVAVVGFGLRKQGEGSTPPGALEGVAVLVAICGGLAGLAAQFVPGAAIKEHPPKQAAMVVRDVKPRITRREYSKRLSLDVHRLPDEDLAEIGNVVWLQVDLIGFKGQPVNLVYGLYDSDAHEALLPGTGKQIPLLTPQHDAQTIFQPIWVGYPRSAHFTAEFRLVDRDGVQQVAATGRMQGSSFRYTCTEH